MSIEANKKIAQQFYDAINAAKFDALYDLCSEDFVFYNQVDTPHQGVDGFINAEKRNFDAFESFRFPIECMVAEDDKVAVYLIFEPSGQKKECLGVPPSGKGCRISVFCLLTIVNGKIVEKRAHFDVADIRRQLSEV
ncbi:ester cyclase [Pseudomonas aeruginosa]|uniref:Uncharacterized protein ORF SG39 n=1 Tax=Pseudomonas aeruginosa TaxID=287 RepID=Q8GPW3_PSEAI|nr:ester cyclase [Pseudomonas aeruginosa]AAN62261.1 hypothetical protein [Pseudomonas aeruginosa]EWH28575.1 ester cyclase [Pseudomonas aeruginosa SG17M]KSR73899.1 ester cyclase [Pseudomonas aeruginosa]RPU87613.1 ester cyclase [Pseudomonas aeruginosa]UFK74877.1 ester cyclase [Pseudomonas aeruginosa SG17M]